MVGARRQDVCEQRKRPQEPRHRRNLRDPVEFISILLHIPAVIDARDRSVRIGNTGHNGGKFQAPIGHVYGNYAVRIKLPQIDRHDLARTQVGRVCGTEERID